MYLISLWNTAEELIMKNNTSIKAYIGMIARNKAKDKIRAIKNWNLELYDDVVLIDNQAENSWSKRNNRGLFRNFFRN